MKLNELFRDRINLRDLGGYRSKDGRVIKKGYFYRSAGLSYMNKSEINEFKQLKIHTILDLRSDKEILAHPDPTIEGTNYIQYSGVITKTQEQIDFSPNGMRQTGEAGLKQLEILTTYYQEIPFENRALQKMFDEILLEHVPLLFHCASGKDRTGIAAMALLMALGVEEQTILEDYLLSNEYRKNMIYRALEGIDQEKDPIMYELVLRMEGVSENTFHTTIDAIYHKYSSFEEYLEKEYQLDEEKIQYLRDTYLETVE